MRPALRRELEDDAAVLAAAVGFLYAARPGGAIEVALRIENQGRLWPRSVRATGKAVEHHLCSGWGELKYGATTIGAPLGAEGTIPTCPSGAVEVALRVEDQPGHRPRSVRS